jgi:hypothetical protein
MMGMALFRNSRPRGARCRETIHLAVDALVNGYDSPSLRMLAGLDLADEPPTDSEMDDYITRCFDEVGCPPPTRDECLARYVLLVAEDITSGALSPKEGAQELRETYLGALCIGAMVDAELAHWTDLAERASWPYLHPEAPAEVLKEARSLVPRSAGA